MTISYPVEAKIVDRRRSIKMHRNHHENFIRISSAVSDLQNNNNRQKQQFKFKPICALIHNNEQWMGWKWMNSSISIWIFFFSLDYLFSHCPRTYSYKVLHKCKEKWTECLYTLVWFIWQQEPSKIRGLSKLRITGRAIRPKYKHYIW